jgi:hypothetical protein
MGAVQMTDEMKEKLLSGELKILNWERIEALKNGQPYEKEIVDLPYEDYQFFLECILKELLDKGINLVELVKGYKLNISDVCNCISTLNKVFRLMPEKIKDVFEMALAGKPYTDLEFDEMGVEFFYFPFLPWVPRISLLKFLMEASKYKNLGYSNL